MASPPKIKQCEALIRKRWKEGWHDSDIAREIGCNRRPVTKWRNRWGLASNAWNERHREKIRQATRRQCEENGVRSLSDMRVLSWRVRAAEQGWPADCTPTEAEALDALERMGEMTLPQLCAALGRPYVGRGSLKTGRGGNTLTARLIRKGYVERLGRRQYAPGKGRTRAVYRITVQRRPLMRGDSNPLATIMQTE